MNHKYYKFTKITNRTHKKLIHNKSCHNNSYKIHNKTNKIYKNKFNIPFKFSL